jgi:RNA polymerase sigma factor (sigma-70 family)
MGDDAKHRCHEPPIVSPKISTRLLAVQSDRRLLDLVAGGYERAFEVLVQRYRGELLRYCRRLGLSEARSEDAVQHALLKAWLALERGEEVRELRAWLYRIAHNTAINIVRRAPEDHRPLADADSVESSVGAETDLERALEVRDALTDVAALPQMQREAILLTALDGRSHEEVASALGITDGAVRGLIYRARTTLRAAAAALTPQPLVAWFCGAAAKVAPTTQRLAEISTQGSAGADATGPLFKGAALAVTAVVLAAGAAEVPLHRHATHRAKASSRPARTAGEVAVGAPVASIGGQFLATHTLGSQAGASRAAKRAGVRGRSGASQPAHRGTRSRHGHNDLLQGTTHSESGDDSTTGAGSGGRSATESAPSATLANSKGRDGGDDGSAGSGGGGAQPPGGSGSQQSGSGGSTQTPQPASSSGDGSQGTTATTTGSESSGQSGPGSGSSSDGRESHGDEAGSADSGSSES